MLKILDIESFPEMCTELMRLLYFNKEVPENKPMKYKYKRNKINQNMRIKIAASQTWKCNHCKMFFNEGGWDINHIIRVSLGGNNELSNLEALCKNCHGVVTANERIRDGF
jgi:5-methylcytosine-specific restriction endonuclease McrA